MRILLVTLISVLFLNCAKEPAKIKISFNENYITRHVVEIENLEDIPSLSGAISETFSMLQNGVEIPVQVIINPLTGKHSLLLYPEVEKKSTLQYLSGKQPQSFTPLTYAELWHKTGGEFIDQKYVGGGDFVKINALRVPDECTDHSFYIKYEGPGWESNLVGYRFYLDWRNAVDVYGKKTGEMILNSVGQDGYDSYHEMQPWGMDVLKVGSTLGVGTIAWWNGEAAERVAETDSVTCEILSEGGLRAQIQTNYYGWQTNDFKTNVQSFISIDANSRLTKQELRFDKAPENVCTGIYIDKNAEKIELQSGNWTCIATWGAQSLNTDNLGLCVFAKTADIISNTADKNNFVLVLKPENNTATWLYGAAWELEPNGIQSKEEFVKYLEAELERLNQPATYKIK